MTSALPSSGHRGPPTRPRRTPDGSLRPNTRRMKSKLHFGRGNFPKTGHTSGGWRASGEGEGEGGRGRGGGQVLEGGRGGDLKRGGGGVWLGTPPPQDLI